MRTSLRLDSPADATHVAFVIDTSGSMRNQLTQQLHVGLINQIQSSSIASPAVAPIQFFDTSGNYMAGGQLDSGSPTPPD